MRYIYMVLGFISVGIGYVGIFVPGLPTTTFIVIAAWLFAKSSPRFNTWLHEHPLFGKYLVDWEQKRIYPTRGKYAMIGTMFISVLIMLFTVSVKGAIYLAITCALISIWAWRYPGSEKEYNRRVRKNERIGWLD